MARSLRLKTTLVAAGLALLGMNASAQPYTENFDNVGNLGSSGWAIQNNSSPLGPNSWYQGVPTTATPDPGPFNAYNGADNAYIAANFASTTGGSGTISNWLITPNRTLRNGDVFQFYTRKPTIPPGGTDFPDRLEVRMSTNGASTNVGTTAAALGDFTTLLLSINPTLTTNVYPQVWTQYTITISGLPAPTSGRIAFRYFVTGGGPSGSNSDYIGVDNVVYTPYVCPTITVSPATLPGGSAGTAYSQSVTATGLLGAGNFAVTAGALPPGLTLGAGGTISGTPTATGTFNFTVTAQDASGCSGARAYSLTTVCPANPLSFPVPAALCSNGSPVNLSGYASPAGGSYSGTGVSGGQFNPAAGTQTVTYDYTDPYGCAHSANQTITVNTAPVVAQAPVSAPCSNGAPVTLGGGTPAGGTYTGTGVSGGQFDPAAGTQTLTYSYTDANGCSNATTFTVTVNTAPVVTAPAADTVCSNDTPLTLTGGSPAGGTYTGTGVTGTEFDPAAGTQTLTYGYTDANGCSDEADFTVTVNTAPTVSQAAVGPVCSNAAPVTLTGGTPAGGTYTGTGVTGTEFDPAAGTQTLTYTYTDANGCTDEAGFDVTVNTAPTVTQGAVAVCANDNPIALTGGAPAGGTYAGTGVTAGEFDPAVGTQTLTYTYTDANGCTDSTTFAVTVNTPPNATFTLPATVCVYGANINLQGSPAGGDYTGSGVTGTEFNPANAGVGSTTLTYTYTDANGCTDEVSAAITVLECAGIDESALNATITAYPNPGTGLFTLALGGISGEITLDVVDMQGKRVYTAQATATEGYQHTVDLTGLANGVYYLRAVHQGRTGVVKLIKQ